MNDRELAAWVVLHHAPGLGPQLALQQVQAQGSAVAALERLREVPPSARTRSWLRADAEAVAEGALAWAAAPGHNLLVLVDPLYPRLLRPLVDPPLVLYVSGELSACSRQQVALVGSRRPTGAGLHITTRLAMALCRAGLAVTAGLASGIDGSAHRGALQAGGCTLAVLGSGLERVYPRTHIGLARDLVAAGGALLSELPLQAPPLPGHFPRRNRLISGLSLGVVVVEASLRSGSLITARHALDQGRELFAVPGSIHNPVSRGCHRLLRQGAALVESIADILEGLGMEMVSDVVERQAAEELPGSVKAFLDTLDFGPVVPEALLRTSGLTTAEISSMLVDLEIRGYVCSQNDGSYCRVR